MSFVKFLLPLVLALATCWANDPIFDPIDPQPIYSIPDGYKLPSDVQPIQYTINLEPYLNIADEKTKFTFTGESTISIKVIKNTKTIKFHAKELTFEEKASNLRCDRKVKEDDKEVVKTISIDITKHETDKEKHFMTLILKEEIKSTDTNCILKLKYTGILNDKLYGFYRTSYQDDNNNIIWLATTQFEPVGARQAFPCWDEPALKAKFDITIRHLSTYHALSNMDILKTEDDKDDKDKKRTIFKTTPSMSTYLVAFVISDFKKEANKDEFYRVWTRPNMLQHAKYALEIGQLTMDVLDEFTGLEYKKLGVPKMDQIAIPGFKAGAMENWGLVTYREPSLLYKENVTKASDKQNIASTISHEFAHQWFGNLVSPKWWEYLWLNEGFANFFQYYTTDKVITEKKKEQSWRLMDQFVVKNLQAFAFVTDAGAKTRPLNQNVATPAQIQSLFDDIAYKKGGSVIRMMQHFLTEDIFKAGLKEYLQNNKEKSVESEDLFKAINDVVSRSARKDIPYEIKIIMKNWVDKPGYPVVTVNRNYEKNEAALTQERFHLIKPKEQDKTQWYIPINYVLEESPEIKDTKVKGWMEPEKSLTINNLNATQWVIFNNNQTGYYRVNYDDKNWERLATYLDSDKYSKISPVSRAQLIDDALNLARAGKLNYDIALKITLYLVKETDYMPWYTAVRAFDYLDRVLQGSEQLEVFHKYVAQKFQGFVKAVKLTEKETKDDTHLMKLGKELAMTTACKYGLNDCKKFAEQELEKWLKDKGNKLSPDLRSGILCYGLQNANEKTWNSTVDRYKSSTDEDEKNAILHGLGCTTSNEIVKIFLALTLEEKPAVDIFSVLSSIYRGNDASFNTLIDFIHQNIDKIRAEDKNNRLISIINQLAYKVTTLEQYGKLALLAQRHEFGVYEGFEGLINARENLEWIELYRKNVTEWIKKNYKEPDTTGNNSASSITLTWLFIIIPVLIGRFY